MLIRLTLRVIVLGTVALVLGGCAPASTRAVVGDDVNYEGLQQVKARGVDMAMVRPGVDFQGYTGLLLEVPELAFRTPDRSQQEFPLSQEQKDRFRDLLATHFQVELANSKQLRLVDEAGAAVLTLRIRIQDVNATVPPNRLAGVGRSGVFLEAAGEATLVLELRDSQSDEVLARAVDARAVEGAAMLQKGGGAVTKWSEVEELCERWASIARERLDALIERS